MPLRPAVAVSLVVTAVLVSLTLVAQRSGDPTGGRAQPRNPQAPQAPTPTPPTEPPPNPNLVDHAYLSYVGAFRLPVGLGADDQDTFNGGGEALTFNPVTRTLFAAGSRCCRSTVAEITIPDVRQASSIEGLAFASYRQQHTDVLRGKQTDVGCGGPLGGLLPWSGSLIASVYCYYDAGYIQTRSHFKTGLDFSNLPAVVGPVEIATGSSEGGRAGFVSGYMTAIPPEWQGPLGGPALTGNCCLPIITRTSWGPAVSVFNPADIGVRSPVPATTLLRYTDVNPTLGRCESDGDVPSNQFNCTTTVAGVVFPEGSGSVLFFGSHGTGKHCYGANTNDPKRHMTPNPEVPGEVVCYDPARGGKGPHAYPYVHKVWAYRASDLLAVKNRQREPWQIVPYLTWSFDTPFQIAARVVTGVAYDPATKRVFVSMGEQDAPRPLVHVFQLQAAQLSAMASRRPGA